MKKLIKFLMLIMLVIFGITADYNIPIDNRTIEEKIMETVVMIDHSSGIVIYSEDERAIVLTVYHVISDNCEAEVCDYDAVEIIIIKNFTVDDAFFEIQESFEVTNIDVSMDFDLALIEISTNRKLESAQIEKSNIRFGNEIYIASNPGRLFRSLKRGIISAPLRIDNGVLVFEISGGIIFGSSGGGIFTLNGGLIGIAKSMQVWKTPFCYDLWDEEGNYTRNICVKQPLPFLGFAIRPEIIKRFIKNSVFCEDFDYQCIDDNMETVDE